MVFKLFGKFFAAVLRYIFDKPNAQTLLNSRHLCYKEVFSSLKGKKRVFSKNPQSYGFFFTLICLKI